jgi:hypothetical protein
MDYENYAAVPWYRKNWFALTCFLAAPVLFLTWPILALVLLTGDVFFERDGKLKKYSRAGKVVLYILMGIGFLFFYILAQTDRPG